MEINSFAITGTCSSCGHNAEGRKYQYRFGWQINQGIARRDLTVIRVASTMKDYLIGGEEEFFLCNACVHRHKRISNISLTLLSLLAGVMFIFLGIGELSTVSYQEGSFWQTVLCCLAPGLLLSLFGILDMFSTRITVHDGERAAIKLARKQGRHERGTIYWTSREYERMIREQQNPL